MSVVKWSAWIDGAAEPLASGLTRQRARTALLVQAGFACQSGDWLYDSMTITGSGNLPDVIELRAAGNKEKTMRFSVRPDGERP